MSIHIIMWSHYTNLAGGIKCSASKYLLRTTTTSSSKHYGGVTTITTELMMTSYLIYNVLKSVLILLSRARGIGELEVNYWWEILSTNF